MWRTLGHWTTLQNIARRDTLVAHRATAVTAAPSIAVERGSASAFTCDVSAQAEEEPDDDQNRQTAVVALYKKETKTGASDR
jgi:hypothetical protein